MQHKRITVQWMDGQQKILAVDRDNGVRIDKGVAYFGRTSANGVWVELLAAPVRNLHHWG